jgi:hypothetical protein
LACFEVTLYGRFWVIPEAENFLDEYELRALKQEFMRMLGQQIKREWAEAVPA